MSLQNGTKERIRCRAQYVVTENGTNLQQSLRCDSDTDQIRINAHINDHGGSLSGGWAEEVHNASGSLRGSAHGDTLSINVASGSAFSAHMSIVTAGGRQSVDIRPKGIGVTDVSVTMTKAR